jgi:hypothetical protein
MFEHYLAALLSLRSGRDLAFAAFPEDPSGAAATAGSVVPSSRWGWTGASGRAENARSRPLLRLSRAAR